MSGWKLVHFAKSLCSCAEAFCDRVNLPITVATIQRISHWLADASVAFQIASLTLWSLRLRPYVWNAHWLKSGQCVFSAAWFSSLLILNVSPTPFAFQAAEHTSVFRGSVMTEVAFSFIHFGSFLPDLTFLIYIGKCSCNSFPCLSEIQIFSIYFQSWNIGPVFW